MAIDLRISYEIAGTEAGYAATRCGVRVADSALRTNWASTSYVSGTESGYAATQGIKMQLVHLDVNMVQKLRYHPTRCLRDARYRLWILCYQDGNLGGEEIIIFIRQTLPPRAAQLLTKYRWHPQTVDPLAAMKAVVPEHTGFGYSGTESGYKYTDSGHTTVPLAPGGLSLAPLTIERAENSSRGCRTWH
eukprot:2470171-Rhodomonas_salina.1